VIIKNNMSRGEQQKKQKSNFCERTTCDNLGAMDRILADMCSNVKNGDYLKALEIFDIFALGKFEGLTFSDFCAKTGAYTYMKSILPKADYVLLSGAVGGLMSADRHTAAMHTQDIIANYSGIVYYAVLALRKVLDNKNRAIAAIQEENSNLALQVDVFAHPEDYLVQKEALSSEAGTNCAGELFAYIPEAKKHVAVRCPIKTAPNSKYCENCATKESVLEIERQRNEIEREEADLMEKMAELKKRKAALKAKKSPTVDYSKIIEISKEVPKAASKATIKTAAEVK